MAYWLKSPPCSFCERYLDTVSSSSLGVQQALQLMLLPLTPGEDCLGGRPLSLTLPQTRKGSCCAELAFLMLFSAAGFVPMGDFRIHGQRVPRKHVHGEYNHFYEERYSILLRLRERKRCERRLRSFTPLDLSAAESRALKPMGFCTRCGEITGSSGRCKCGGTSKGSPRRWLLTRSLLPSLTQLGASRLGLESVV